MLYLLSIHLAGCSVVNLWCIQCMIKLYHSIYAYNQMRLYTTINDALNVCYQYDIWHMWNTRSNTVNQRTFTSSDHDDNSWYDNNISNSWLKEMYICQLSWCAFPPSTSSVCFTACRSMVYLIHTHRRNCHHHHHHHRKNYMYRQLLRCDCSEEIFSKESKHMRII